MSDRIFLDVWDNENAQNFRVVFREAGISEPTVMRFAQMFWIGALEARRQYEAEGILAKDEEE